MNDAEQWKQPTQHAKKVVSDSLGLVDFAVGLVNSVINLPDGQAIFLGEFKLQKNCNQSCSSNFLAASWNDFQASTC